MIAKERLYLTPCRKGVVREGDARAAYLLAGVGDEIEDRVAEGYGIADGRLVIKEAAALQNKEIKTPENKQGRRK